jgi:hypothetical protein
VSVFAGQRSKYFNIPYLKLMHIATISLLSNIFHEWAESSVFLFIWNKVERLQCSVAVNVFTTGGLGVFHIPYMYIYIYCVYIAAKYERLI